MVDRPTRPFPFVPQSGPERPVVEVPAGADPNHHLWQNGRLWWIAFTVHRGHLQERVRFSLGTPDVLEARRRRDGVFRLAAEAEDCRISLRFAPRRSPTPASADTAGAVHVA